MAAKQEPLSYKVTTLWMREDQPKIFGEGQRVVAVLAAEETSHMEWKLTVLVEVP